VFKTGPDNSSGPAETSIESLPQNTKQFIFSGREPRGSAAHGSHGIGLFSLNLPQPFFFPLEEHFALLCRAQSVRPELARAVRCPRKCRSGHHFKSRQLVAMGVDHIGEARDVFSLILRDLTSHRGKIREAILRKFHLRAQRLRKDRVSARILRFTQLLQPRDLLGEADACQQ
jgi:hypothetical protein